MRYTNYSVFITPIGLLKAVFNIFGVSFFVNNNQIHSMPINENADFIRSIIAEHLKSNRYNGNVHTRFPPEPNGYLHIGHAKSICLNFGIANDHEGGLCNLRYDDTNPVKEDVEYVDSIRDDVRWLGFSWDDREFYASDYFEKMYQYAVELIKLGKAYVCELTPDQLSEYRGAPTEPGKESPFRNRSIEENLTLFEDMRSGKFADGSITLRAKIDMSSPNVHMRDPVIYRVKHAEHHRTGDAWCIYPMYDYAHCLSDSFESITHSICTLEFEVHRPLYDWFLDTLNLYHPQQIEFARLNLNYTVLSKRKLLRLVQEGHVSGWDDPRMPTIAGFRRRGYTPEAIRNFAEKVGVAKREAIIDVGLLEWSIREDLNKRALRAMAVLNPIKVVITNYPEGETEMLEAVNNPEDPEAGKRLIPFSKELYIEQDDFKEVPQPKYFRLYPGNEVRLRYAYIIKCEEVVKDEAGNIVELRCTYDPSTKSGSDNSGKKVKSTIHWVSANHAINAEVRMYDRLFATEVPDDAPEGKDFLHNMNPNSLEVLTNCKLEPSLGKAEPSARYQFERLGYFVADSKDHSSEKPVFNRTVTLKDSWQKIEAKK